MPSKAKPPRVFVVLGPKDEELLYFGDGAIAIMMVVYPYRKTKDAYVAIQGHPIHCCNGCDEDIRMPKRGPSLASSRRIVRHFLSHHRRHRTLLPWWDSGPKLVETNVCRLMEGKIWRRKKEPS